MNRALVQEIVRCVASSDDTASHFERFQEHHWEESLPWLYKSGLTFPLLKRIETSRTVSAAILTRLQADLTSNKLRMADMFQEFQNINEAFQSAGLRFAVQKGFSLIPDYCPGPAVRHQTDFDYLLAPHCLKQARDILRTRGYVSETHTETELVLQTPLKAQPPEHHFFILQPSRSVELHLQMWQGTAGDAHLPAPNDALEHIEYHTLYGHTFPALSAEDIFLGQVIHALRHIFYFWTRLSWLYEISQFLRLQQDNASFWRRVGARAQWNVRMGEIIGVVLSLTEELFGVSAPPSLASWTTNALPIALRLWVKRYGREFALAPAPGSKLSLLLEEHFIPDPAEWRRSRNARLFPMHRPKPLTAEPPAAGTSIVLKSSWKQRLHLLHRINFHGRSLIRYSMALPMWRWGLYQAMHKADARTRPSAGCSARVIATERAGGGSK